MQQQTLSQQEKFPEQESSKAPEKPKDDIVSRLTENTQLNKKINKWIEQCKEKKENFAYMRIDYLAEPHIDGTRKEGLSTETAVERIFKKEDDSYGGSWGMGITYTKQNLDELKKDIIDWKAYQLSYPYSKEKSDGHLIRDIRRENIRIFIDDNGKDFISREASWSIKDLAQELTALKEAELTEEYLKKVERLEFIDREIHRIEYEIIPELKKMVEAVFNSDEQQTLAEDIDYNKIIQKIKDNKCNLKQMQKEYDALRKELYRW